MSGPLARSPLSPEFWGGMVRGLRDNVAQPMAQDAMQGHQALKEHAPLPYQIAQMHPAVGIPAAALEYAGNYQQNNTEGMVKAALSAVPVAEKAFRVGTAVPTTLRQAASVSGAQHGVNLAPWLGGVYKAGAAENVKEMGDAAYDQTRRAIGGFR